MKFVLTEEEMLLDHAIIEVQKLLSAESSRGKDEEYINSLVCYIECDDSKSEMSLVQAILWSITYWCDSKLQDYHLHFSEVASLSVLFLKPYLVFSFFCLTVFV